MATNDKKCLTAFEKSNYTEAVRLLLLVKKPKELFTYCYGCGKIGLLHLAVMNGWLDVVKNLITKYNFEPTKGDSKYILHIAVEKNHIDVVKFLIADCGCDPLVGCDWLDRTCLQIAVENNHIDVVKYLINQCGCHPMVAENRTCLLHVALEKNHADMIRCLINKCGCDPMVIDEEGRTCLHLAVERCNLSVVKYLLSTGKVNPSAKDNNDMTPLMLANGNEAILSLFHKFGNIKTSHPVDSYVNILLLGNPGAGKSTLAQVIIEKASGAVTFGQFRNVKDVELCTAGIIPTKLEHKELGNVILHDFAGHSEYYSSHTAVIENLLQGSGAVFVIVVDITNEESSKHLHQWLTIVNNEVHKCISQCHLIVAVSHIDKMTDTITKNKRLEELSQIISLRCDPGVPIKYLDCRKLGGNNIISLLNELSSSCQSIRSTSGRNLSLYCHMMYAFLEDSQLNILSLFDIVNSPLKHQYALPEKVEEIYEILCLLSSTGLICLVKSHEDTSKVWVVVNKQILLAEVNGILFAPKSFKEYRNVASNTGIITLSYLIHLFPYYDPYMLICFLTNMALCQEIDPQFLTIINLKPIIKNEDKLLFFPTLLDIDRPHNITGRVFKFGWCLQCTEDYHFFPPHFFHIIMLHFAYKFGLPKNSGRLSIINRQCTFWTNGIHWFNGNGVETLVEMVDESQCVLVLMSCEKGYERNMISLQKDVIAEAVEVHTQSCPSIKTSEFVIDPEELNYPIEKPAQRTVYNVADIIASARDGNQFVNSEPHSIERKILKKNLIKNLLTDEIIKQLCIHDPKELTSKECRIVTSCKEEKLKKQCTVASSDLHKKAQGSLNNTGSNGDPANDGKKFSHNVSRHQFDAKEITTTKNGVTKSAVLQKQRISSSKNDSLNIGDLDDIILFLKHNQFEIHRWQDLGLQLGLFKPTLEAIDKDCKGQSYKCLVECLAAWLRREDKVMDKGCPSWTSLADALLIFNRKKTLNAKRH